MIAATVRAAAAMDLSRLAEQAPEAIAEEVEATVSDRLQLLRPVLAAQATHGLSTGSDRHSPTGLMHHDAILKANVARHAGFDDPKLVSEIT